MEQYTQTEQALLWLHNFSLSYKKREGVLAMFEDPQQMLQNFEKKSELLRAMLGDETYKKMTKEKPTTLSKRLVEQLAKQKIKFTTIQSPSYPKALREISAPPLVLFYLGNPDLFNKTQIAVVGTRKPTAYGKEVCKKFSQFLSQNGVVLTSGLAYGIDSIAHSTALEEHGQTIAVMAGGLDSIYPAEHTMLAKQIVKCGGLLTSEYFPGVKPTAYSFPDRNRIVSGLSNGVLVIEAGEKSGSLHTISHAIDQNKELFIVPANITSVASFGSNRILSEMPHALVTDPAQILERLGLEQTKNAQTQSLDLTEQERIIYNLCLREPIDFDELAQKSQIPTNSLGSLLTMMEMRGIIKRLPANQIMVTKTE